MGRPDSNCLFYRNPNPPPPLDALDHALTGEPLVHQSYKIDGDTRRDLIRDSHRIQLSASHASVLSSIYLDTEGGDAPGWPGAKSEHIGIFER